MATLKRYSVPSAVRTLAVLESLAQCSDGLSLSEISRKLALPKTSAYLILNTLERHGYVHKNSQDGKYRFGFKLVGLSRMALDHLDLRQEARPFLQALMGKTGLTVHLAVLEWNKAKPSSLKGWKLQDPLEWRTGWAAGWMLTVLEWERL